MDLTILIKTFRRPLLAERLVLSIKKYYPDIEILTLDDSNEDSPLGFDIGISRGRNELVKRCNTKYCMILDDDCVFTDETNLELALRELKEKDLDILQLTTPKLVYQGLFETNGGTVTYKHGNKDGLYDFCLNIFIAKTESLRKYPWDEEQKIGEHFAYFYEHQGKLKIGVTKNVVIDHLHEDAAGYGQYRDRAVSFVKIYLNKKGLSKRVDLNNNIIKA